jgi:hypothetical protein
MAVLDVMTFHCPLSSELRGWQAAELSVCLTARTFGTAAVSGNWAQHWLYWVVSSQTSTVSKIGAGMCVPVIQLARYIHLDIFKTRCGDSWQIVKLSYHLQHAMWAQIACNTRDIST